MDSQYRFPASPGTPLFPVSPERANQQRYPTPNVPNSPSLPDIDSLRHVKQTSSDVQGKVAQFNSLSKEALERRRANEAALKRAVIGREEAESEARRIREDVRRLNKEVEEGKERERKVGERMEGIMEDLQRSKETHTHSQTLYEKEVRRARKEAFKSSSALVKLQEELKGTRESLRITQSGLELQKVKVEKREQEAFAAQYQLVGVQEELIQMRERAKVAGEEKDIRAEKCEQEAFTAQCQLVEVQEGLTKVLARANLLVIERDSLRIALQENVVQMRQQIAVVAEERDALKTSLRGEEVARIAAEGRIALPPTKEDEEPSSPKKSRESDVKIMELAVEAIDKEEGELAVLRKRLRWERMRREKADQQVDFMKMECQFRCCSCRVAERRGMGYVHDATLIDAQVEKKAEAAKHVSDIYKGETQHVNSKGLMIADPTHPEKPDFGTVQHQSTLSKDCPEPLIDFSPTTGTFRIHASTPSHQEAPPPPSSLHLLDGLISDSRPLLSHTTSAPLPSDHSFLYLFDPPVQSDAEPSPSAVEVPFALQPQIPASTSPQHQQNHHPVPAPSTPQIFPRSISTSTTTTLIPLAPSPTTPLTVSREEALEQIRQRRGRARSIAAGAITPRRQMLEGVAPGGRRDISAPAVRNYRR
ncbi:MAG: hypothetical protein M1827_003348 [Pycnora praestabilis]|nr:MAG: hypothetical protein M1827_003348 [Pycnora praestabilis]